MISIWSLDSLLSFVKNMIMVLN